MLLGLWRGFFREFFSLLTWLIAFIVAFLFVDIAAQALQEYIPSFPVRVILAFGGLFVATLIVGGLLGIIIRWLRKRSVLSLPNRIFGLVFGFIRGSIFVVLLILATHITPLSESLDWQQSVFIPYYEPIAQHLQELLPGQQASEPELALPAATTN